MANSDKERLEKTERERRDEIERLKMELSSNMILSNALPIKNYLYISIFINVNRC
jgi:hypothetical protein